MKNIILAVIAVAFSFNATAAINSVYDQRNRLNFRTELLNVHPNQKADPAPISADELIQTIKFDKSFMSLSADWTALQTSCGDEGYFFLNLLANGTIDGQPQTISISVQTLNSANLHRIYDAISANYYEKGLPACLLKDAYVNEPTESFFPYHAFIFQPVPTKMCTIGGLTYGFPITSCVNEKNLYP